MKVAAVQTADGAIQFAYRDSDPQSHRPVVVLIHGSPGSSEVLVKLGDALSEHFRVIIPDLPGFGSSTHTLPNYSFRAHADYLLQLLTQIGVRHAHIVGFSMGGGVALSAYNQAPDRILSITMLSAIGVQECELTGNYWMNHVIHGVQLAVLSALRYGTPHFGRLDRFPLNVEYARNFYDSDQRPLRGILQRYQGPMLILHGGQDRNVPIAAALEHHLIVPQSKLVIFTGNHFMAFQRPDVLAGPLIKFLSEAEAGESQAAR